jgi:hypothetical protein
VSEQLLRQPPDGGLPFVGPSERRAVPPLPPLPWDRRFGVAFVDLSRLSLDGAEEDGAEEARVGLGARK